MYVLDVYLNFNCFQADDLNTAVGNSFKTAYSLQRQQQQKQEKDEQQEVQPSSDVPVVPKPDGDPRQQDVVVVNGTKDPPRDPPDGDMREPGAAIDVPGRVTPPPRGSTPPSQPPANSTPPLGSTPPTGPTFNELIEQQIQQQKHVLEQEGYVM